MVNFSVNVLFEEGMHARPAAQLVQACQTTASKIAMYKDGKKANPQSIMSILSLGISKNDELAFEIEGSDEAEMAEKLKKFFSEV
ncbi:HPr family phosphocarrier protein [Fusibacter bizertensis]